MQIIDGNILDVDYGVVMHQVNCRRVMGAGVAKQLRAKYPQHYQEYLATQPILGHILPTRIHGDLYIVGLYAQDGFGRDRVYTDYQALAECLTRVARKGDRLPLYAPYKIGCANAGGNWERVQRTFDMILPTVTFVRMKGGYR